MIDIAYVNETENNTEEYENLITKVFDEIVKEENISTYYEVSVVFVNKDKIQEINREYRDLDRVTDVISFAMLDETDEEDIISDEPIDPTLGDIFICLDRAKEQAAEYQHSIQREVGFLACHGFLHLLGYNHEVPEEEKVMFQKQEDILNSINLKR